MSAGQADQAHRTQLVELLQSTRSVEDFLDSLANAAATLLTVSCGITLRRDSRPLTVASSDALAAAVDEVQYGKGQGPCLQTLATGQPVDVPDLASERRWDGYPAQALGYGVRSSLSLPLRAGGQTLGAMNLYAEVARAFQDPGDVSRAHALAAQGGAVLTVALHQAQQSQLTDQLRQALAGRSVIDQAIGIVMGQQRCNASEAFAVLRTASQTRNRKLRDVAVDLVTSVGGPPVERPSFTEPRS